MRRANAVIVQQVCSAHKELATLRFLSASLSFPKRWLCNGSVRYEVMGVVVKTDIERKCARK